MNELVINKRCSKLKNSGFKMPNIFILPTLATSVKKQTQRTICYIKTKKEQNDRIELATHKTAHLQTTQEITQTKFAKELFSCQRTQAHTPPHIKNNLIYLEK